MLLSVGHASPVQRSCVGRAASTVYGLLSQRAATRRASPRRQTLAMATATNGHISAAHAAQGTSGDLEQQYLTMRAGHVVEHFPGALGVDDFLSRVEIALFELGFNGENAIAMTNLCRDEVTAALKLKIEDIFGSSFNTNGLGGVLTCGVTGVKAGLSHSPLAKADSKERYVFFSFPHIAIDAQGTVGNISRPGRPGPSAACGALKGALGELHANGIQANESQAGAHDSNDPEYSILKQRLARRLTKEGVKEDQAKTLDLVGLTKVAERTITGDLEGLISKAVDNSKADYAVVTGVQIHNWGSDFTDDSPTLEFIYPGSIYAVVGGQPKSINLTAFPGLTPRQINLVASGRSDNRTSSGAHATFEPTICGATGTKTTLRSVDVPHSHNENSLRHGTERNAKYYAERLKSDKK